MSTDHLINELFPAMGGNGQPAQREAGGGWHSFDEHDVPPTSSTPSAVNARSSGGNSSGCAFTRAENQSGTGSGSAPSGAAPASSSGAVAARHGFDDDTDDDGDGNGNTTDVGIGDGDGGVPARSVSASSPIAASQESRQLAFPTLASSATAAAANGPCVLTNWPHSDLHEHYARQRRAQLEQVLPMLSMAASELAGRSPLDAGVSLAMGPALAKRFPFAAFINAFHLTHPLSGNGGDPQRGSPVLFCLRCDHVVVRLQDAAWADAFDAGAVPPQQQPRPNAPPVASPLDLYLTARYFYPDWCRLLTTVCDAGNGSGGGGRGATSLAASPVALRPMPPGPPHQRWAAYCCQCAWATVGVEAMRFTTTAVDLARHSGRGGASPTQHPRFITHITPQNLDALTAARGAGADGTRLPLWVSRGPTP